MSMTNKVRISYHYRTFDIGCGCCSDSESIIEFSDRTSDIHVPVMENENDLIEFLDVSQWDYFKNWRDNFEIEINECVWY